MGDRFDLQLASGKLLDGMGLDYVAESYQVVKNGVIHTLGAALTPVLARIRSYWPL